MYTQFFGNYLLSHDYVTNEELFSAMQKQSTMRTKLGTLAIHQGYMNASEVNEVVIIQTHEDKKFGEIAIEQGFLTDEQVIELLKAQTPDFLVLGQILVDDGVISYEDLENIITDYRSLNELYELDLYKDTKDNIRKLFDNYFLVSENGVSEYGTMFMELLFNNLIRFVGEDFTPVDIKVCEKFPTKNCTSQKVVGEYSLTTYIDMDEETAIKFASRYAGENFTDLNEYVTASLEDFLNLHNGLFAVNLSNEKSCELTLEPPMQETEDILHFDSVTYHFPILFSFGTVHFLISILSN